MINITSITIVRSTGTDKVFLNTTLPAAVYPFTDTATLRLEVAYGKAEEYCAANFPGVPVVVNKA